MSKTTIRLLTEADLDSFKQLRLRAVKEEPESFGLSFEEASSRSIEEWTEQLRCSEHNFIFGAFDPTLVGMLGFRRRQGVKKKHKGDIWGLYVAPEGREQGTGKALLSATIERAKTIPDLEYLMLGVVSSNKSARNLYLSLGFQPYASEFDLLRVGNQSLDEDFMSLRLHANHGAHNG